MDGELRLTNLPTEVLWRIAACGPAESTLALTAVNRRLRSALHDSLVFKSIIDCRQGDDDAGVKLDVSSIAPALRKDFKSWARLAVADSKARAYPWQQLQAAVRARFPPAKVRRHLINLDRFVPYLLVLKHTPLINSEPIECLLRPLFLASRMGRHGRPIDEDDKKRATPGLSFYFCFLVLSFIRDYPDYKDGSLASKLLRVYMNDMQEIDCSLEDIFKESFAPEMAHVSLASWASLLHAHIEMLENRNPLAIPNPSQIPWPQTTTDGRFPLPLPTDNSPDDGIWSLKGPDVTWQDWYHDRVAAMSSPDFLTDGEWCGYWSFDNYAYGSPSVSFAESIDRMALQVPIPITRSSARHGGSRSIEIIATYPDSLHNLVLHGFIFPDGVFGLGPPGDSWFWRGRMTPFGMFGYWGSSDFSRVAGACWLWKKSWSEPQPPSADPGATASTVFTYLNSVQR